MASHGYCTEAELTLAASILASPVTALQVCNNYNVSNLSVVGAVLSFQIKEQQNTVQQLQYGLNTAVLVLGAYGVFVMQIGFAMFVAGVVRAKNMSSILLKSVVDTCISCVCFYLVGWGFLGLDTNTNGFVGTTDFALSSDNSMPYDAQYFVWSWMFCAASTTIMAGSVAERCTFTSYLLYAVFYASWVYPVNAHWSWSTSGWLSPFSDKAILGMGVIDFAGSGVVHTLGGFAAIMGSIVLGARVGRWDDETKHLCVGGENPQLYLLGTFLLWFGWFFFNSISLLTIKTFDGDILARTAACTALSAAAGGLGSTALVYLRTKTWNMLSVCSGILGGLVAITSGCSVVEPWAALIAGGIGSVFVTYGAVLAEWLRIDDPAESFAIHALPGIWGMLFVGLLAKEQYVMDVYGKPSGQGFMGIFYGGHGQILLCNFIAVVTNIAWVCFWMYPFFRLLNALGILRVEVTAEALGMDASHMGVTSVRMGNNPMDTKITDTGSRFVSQSTRQPSARYTMQTSKPRMSGSIGRAGATPFAAAAAVGLGLGASSSNSTRDSRVEFKLPEA